MEYQWFLFWDWFILSAGGKLVLSAVSLGNWINDNNVEADIYEILLYLANNFDIVDDSAQSLGIIEALKKAGREDIIVIAADVETFYPPQW